MKNSIKREQSQTGLSFAEREKSRPQVKKMKSWVMAATLVCGLAAVGYGFSSCEKANAQEDNPVQKVTSEELIRTSQSWDGVELPDYFEGRPELVAVKYVFHHRPGRQGESGA